MEERNVNWMLVMSLRYALNRDNGGARSTFEMLVFDAIDYIKDKKYKEYTIEKLIKEIEKELRWSPKKDEQSWLVLIEKLEGLKMNKVESISLAEKMFNELGYTLDCDTDDEISYTLKAFNDWGLESDTSIIFSKRGRTYEKEIGYYDTNEEESLPIRAYEHKAITEQMKELGWLDE